VCAAVLFTGGRLQLSPQHLLAWAPNVVFADSVLSNACFSLLQLLVSCSDNNVKLIVLDRLQELKDKHKDVMQVCVWVGGWGWGWVGGWGGGGGGGCVCV
jgi:hypothetical protein